MQNITTRRRRIAAHRPSVVISPGPRHGFTLIELLVVMAVIGVLIAILTPVVMQAQESARQVACQNNLRQMGAALISFEGTFRRYPTAGAQSYTNGQVWGAPASDPPNTRLVDRAECGDVPCEDQTWGWQYQILPWLADGNNTLLYNQRDPAVVRGTVVATYQCPSKPGNGLFNNLRFRDDVQHTGLPLLAFGGTDYAGSIGVGSATSFSPLIVGCGSSPPNIAVRDAGPFVPRGERISHTDIKDGTAHTLFVGEKWADPDHVGDAYHGQVVGFVGGWAETNACGISEHFPTDTLRIITDRFGPNLPPEPANTILHQSLSFGGWHPGVAYFLTGDGAVHEVPFGIDRDLLRRLGTRAGEELIDGTEF